MKFCLDRLEGRLAVCLCEDENPPCPQYRFSLDDHPILATFEEGMLFEAELISDQRISAIVPLPKETEERRSRATARLHALAARTKKKKEG